MLSDPDAPPQSEGVITQSFGNAGTAKLRAEFAALSIPVFSACVACACGAKYERAEAHLPIKDVGAFECQVCGEVIERWHGRVVPTFKRVAAPASKTSSAA